ncbi:MAG: superoxide dismutase [Cyanobacteria bacterium J06623_7]
MRNLPSRVNQALAEYPELQNMTIEELLSDLDDIPEDIRTTIRNSGGGHANHTMFWSIMTPDSTGEPTGAIAEAIDDAFGDFDTFKQEFNDAGKSQFGSGWAWLVLDNDGNLAVTSTANQDNPITDGSYPIMGNDVWEHAYYLKYQNKRGDYLDAWWNVVNWDEVNLRLEQAEAWWG